MTILRVLAVGTAVLMCGAYVAHYVAAERDRFHWPVRARAERTLERARQRGAHIGEKTAAAAAKIVAKTEAAAVEIGDRTSAAASRIGDKTSVAATKIATKTSIASTKLGEKTAVAKGKVERRVTETALSARIKAKMALDDDVDASAIDVSTHGTAVTLRGTVASQAERARAVALARETAGVTRVVDDLQLR
jgi:osmotically-inducible protein OsmY